MEDNKYIENQLSDHEQRLRRLEESDIQQRIQLTNIEKNLAETRLEINSSNEKLLNAIIENGQTSNKIKLIDRKEFWGVIGVIVSAILVYLGIK
ncbi:hypothetical protein [Clostridium cuniculi]|uniref:hypothetical protein n=1 Tax=Clostridium cuniculi TaxID=2548455 RepID=UPI0010549970|nr:hypothetical protein [Clostridium cuniculi]